MTTTLKSKDQAHYITFVCAVAVAAAFTSCGQMGDRPQQHHQFSRGYDNIILWRSLTIHLDHQQHYIITIIQSQAHGLPPVRRCHREWRLWSEEDAQSPTHPHAPVPLPLSERYHIGILVKCRSVPAVNLSTCEQQHP